MADAVTLELIQRMLQQVLDGQRGIVAEMGDLRQRISALETTVAALHRDNALLHESYVHLRHALDRQGERIERIERRLGILEPEGSAR